MTVLHVITGLTTGGAERALSNVLAGGLAQWNESVVLSLRDEGTMGPRIRELGVPVHTLEMRGGVPTPRAVARLFRLVRVVQPSVIQGWMYHGNLAASLAARLAPNTPALAWNIRHSLYSLESEKALTRQVIRGNRFLSAGADAVIYNSQLSRRQHEAFGFESAQGQVIPNGFDLDALKPDPVTRQAVREDLGIPPDALVIGHVARFHPMKDHATFLRAAVAVARQVPEARFLLVGRDISPNNPALSGIVPPELLGCFAFTGERCDAHRLMSAMDFFCLSSWSEAFPNVLGEAMACGVPCVTTDVGDSANIVGDTGEVVPPSDDQALVRGLLSMLAMPAERRGELGRSARARIEANYSLDAIVTQYIQLYQRLMIDDRE